MKSIFKFLVQSAFLLGAILCFALTIILTLTDHVAGGTLMAGLFVTLVLFHYLPQMESFKAYGVEAKMHAKLSEADDILSKLRAVAKVSGKLAYHTISWSSRMSHPVREKQAVADAVDALLRDLGADESELAAHKKEYIHFILFDLHAMLGGVAQQLFQSAIKRMSEHPRQELDQFARAVRRDELGPDFRRSCEAIIPRDGLLEADDARKLRGFIARVVSAGEESTRKGGYSEDALKLIEAWKDGPSPIFDEVFGRNRG